VSQNRRRHAARNPLLSVAIALAFVAPMAHAAGHPPPTDYDQFIVKFKDTSPEKGNAALRQQRLDVLGRARGLHVSQLRRMAVGADVIHTDRRLDARGIKDFINTLRADPRVEYAEVDLRVFPTFTPNDASYATQWHYYEATGGINAPAAWDVTDGTGQVVAVIDTGIVPHSDLTGNVIAGYDFITDSAAARDSDGRDSNPNDEGDWYAAGECGQVNAANSSWHGTHVAGTIAALTNNSVGVAGVAFGAKVMPVRVLGKCGGSSSDINDAIVWASGGTVSGITSTSTPARILNLSLGGGGSCLASTQASIDTAVANGATVVIAAGNNNDDSANHQPGNCNNILTVAALDRTGARASYSNYGSLVDIAAPGGGNGNYILSTLNAGTTTQGAESYASYQGTSMATPHVAGSVALARAAGLTAGNTLSAAQMISLIETTSRAFPVACAPGCGAGVVDAGAAVVAAGKSLLTITDPTAVYEGNSGTQVYTFTVMLSKAAATDVTFDIATSDGTATAGSDYVAKTSLSQTIPAGSTTKTFTVTVNGDATGELSETFNVTVSNVTGGPVTVLDATGVGTILNDDTYPLSNGVAVTGLADAVAGHNTYFTLAVPSGATNLQFTMSGGSGDADLYVRYGAAPTTSTFDCRPYISGNAETCGPTASPTAGTWYVMLNTYEAYSGVTLTGSYTVPVDISIGDTSVTEGDSGTKVITFTVTLSGATTGAVTYDIHTLDADGSATAGSDYVSRSLTGESIAAGLTSKTFTVTVNGDTTNEFDETVPVEIYNVVGATLTDGQGIGTITNDDGPSLSVGDASVTEGNSGTKVMTFTVSLSKVGLSAVTYDIATANNTATAGSDYVASTLVGQSIPAGQLSKTFSVTINGDATVEANEILRANVTNASVAITDAQGTGTIINDDGPVLSIADAGFVEGNSGTKSLVFTVSLSQASVSAVTYDITTNNGTAAAGSDYVTNALVGETIAAGLTSKTFSVTVNGDTAVEGNETFFVNLSNASVSLADSQAKATITNDDGPVLSIGDASITEADSGTTMMTFTVSLSQVAPAAVTFDFTTVAGTALAGPDYVPTSVTGLKIPAGQLSKLVSVPIKGDLVAEPDETFTASISLSNVSIKDGVGVGTIFNDD
jgi:serine protease